MTLQTLAQELGFRSHTFISALEFGKRQPSLDLVVKLVAIFGVSFDQLLDDALELAPTRRRDRDRAADLWARLGARLRSLRIAKRLSTQQAANVLNLSPAYLVDLEAGRRLPSLPLLLTLADFYAVTPNDLLLPDLERTPDD